MPSPGDTFWSCESHYEMLYSYGVYYPYQKVYKETGDTFWFSESHYETLYSYGVYYPYQKVHKRKKSYYMIFFH